MHMVMFVLDDMERLDAVLDALHEIGVSGATVIESTGLHRHRAARTRIPLRFNFEQLGPIFERGNYTVFTLVENEAMVNRCVKAIENVVGDLDLPNTGVLAAWPVTYLKGVPHQKPGA